MFALREVDSEFGKQPLNVQLATLSLREFQPPKGPSADELAKEPLARSEISLGSLQKNGQKTVRKRSTGLQIEIESAGPPQPRAPSPLAVVNPQISGQTARDESIEQGDFERFADEPLIPFSQLTKNLPTPEEAEGFTDEIARTAVSTIKGLAEIAEQQTTPVNTLLNAAALTGIGALAKGAQVAGAVGTASRVGLTAGAGALSVAGGKEAIESGGRTIEAFKSGDEEQAGRELAGTLVSGAVAVGGGLLARPGLRAARGAARRGARRVKERFEPATEVEAEVVTPRRQRRRLAPAREPIDVQGEVISEPAPALAKGERPKRRVAGGTVERRKLKARPADTAPRRLPSPADRAPSQGTVTVGGESKRVFFGDPVLDPQGLPVKPVREAGPVRGGPLALRPKKQLAPAAIEQKQVRLRDGRTATLDVSAVRISGEAPTATKDRNRLIREAEDALNVFSPTSPTLSPTFSPTKRVDKQEVTDVTARKPQAKAKAKAPAKEAVAVKAALPELRRLANIGDGIDLSFRGEVPSKEQLKEQLNSLFPDFPGGEGQKSIQVHPMRTPFLDGERGTTSIRIEFRGPGGEILDAPKDVERRFGVKRGFARGQSEPPKAPAAPKQDLAQNPVEKKLLKVASKTLASSQKQRQPKVRPVEGAENVVLIPGTTDKAAVRYSVRDAADVETSADPTTLQPNPNYQLRNDRIYSDKTNSERILRDEASFEPAFHITDTPTAADGPPIIDPNGNVLGGNRRAIVLQRVIAKKPLNFARYKKQLIAKAANFGLDPKAIGSMKSPMLVREVLDAGIDRQRAIRDFNEKGTADLTPSEQALSDSTRVSERTLTKITDAIEEAGEKATLASVLDASGPEILEDLIRDGAINIGEKARLLDEQGKLNAAAKDRIAKTLLGRVFRDPAQFKRTNPSIRNNLERSLPHIIRVESRADFNLTPDVQQAIDILEFSRGSGVNLKDLAKQKSLLANRPDLTPRGLAIAGKLREGPIKAAKAFRQYANEADLSRQGGTKTFFDPPTPAESFEAAFGRVSAKLDGLEAGARARFNERNGAGGPEAGKAPALDDLIDLATIGAVKLARGVRTFGQFAKEMVAEFGERIRSSLREIFDRAKKLVADFRRDERGGLQRKPKQPDERQSGLFSAGEDVARRQATKQFKAEVGGKQLTAEFGTKSQKKLDAGKKQIADAPLFGGDRQVDLFGPERGPERRIPLELHELPPGISREEFGRIHKPTRSFQRAQASFRLTIAQKERVGQFFYETPLRPNIAFPTEAAAKDAAFEVFKKIKSGERGSLSTDLATLGTAKFVTQEVIPTARAAAGALLELGDDVLRIFAPTARAPSAAKGALILRERLAVMQRKMDRAEFALRKARKFFDARAPEDNFDFIAKIESGEAQGDADLDSIAGVLRTLLDGRRRDVQSLGSGKLQSFHENYFPHIWKKRRGSKGQSNDDDAIFKQIFGRRPLEGSKSFLKRRTLPTFADGLEVGLEPVSQNPVDLTMLKIREMDRFVMAHETLKDFRESGIAKFVPVEKMGPVGWKKIEDPIGTVYGKAAVNVGEFFDKQVMDKLNTLAKGLGFKVERVAKIPRKAQAAGVAYKGSGRIKTRFASPWDVLAHELGHQLDWKFGLMDRLMKSPPAKPLKETKAERTRRVELKKQLRSLADLRFEGSEPSPSFLRYVREKAEKGAAVVQAYLYAPDKMRQVAPDVYAEFEGFITDNPALHPLRDIKPSLVLGSDSMEFRLQGLLIKGNWYAPEPAAVVLNNHLSPGLRSRSGIFRAALGANNVMNQAQLGMSAFHLTNTVIDSITSQYGLAIQQASQGRPVRALQSLAKVGIAPINNIVKGGRLITEWYQPGGGGDEIARIIEAVTMAGGRVMMDRAFHTTFKRSFLKAIKTGNIIGGVLRLPFAAIEVAAWPIMEFVVPRMKMGAFMELARSELERMGPNAPREAVRERLAKAWDVIDDRLGEVVYDNLFWNRWAKDIAMITARSVGWNWGTWRVIFGGAADLGIQTARAGRRLAGRGSDVADNSREGLTFRASYLIGFVTMTSIVGSIIHMLLTGEQPETVDDYFFPRTGELNDDGKPRRVTLPTYMKDVFHLWADPIGTVTNKVSPLLNLTTDMLSNQDFFGTEIRNTDEPIVQQLIDAAKFIGEQGFTPFGVRNLQRARKSGLPLREQLLPFVGLIPPARKAIASPAERFMIGVIRAKSLGPARTKIQSERAQLRARITGRLRAKIRSIPRGGPSAADLSREGLREGTLTPQDLTRAVRNAARSPLIGLFQRMPLEDAIKALELADPDERRMLIPELIKKLPGVALRPRREQDKLIPKLRKLLTPTKAAP